VTPFSDSLPIKRHSWKKSQKRDFEMVYVSVLDMKLKKIKQTYTFLDYKDNQSGVFHYQSGKFESPIVVDDIGFVLNYHNIFSRKY
jgi:uncharacterized protein